MDKLTMRNNLERAVPVVNSSPRQPSPAHLLFARFASANEIHSKQFERVAIGRFPSGNGRRQLGVADQNRRTAVYGPTLRCRQLGFISLPNQVRDRTHHDSSVADTSPVSKSYAPKPETVGIKIRAGPSFQKATVAPLRPMLEKRPLG